MAKENALTGSQIAKFKSISLHEFLQVITDSRGPRVVVHEFPNRDGGKVETLGRRPHTTSWQLTFTGDDWRAKLTELVASIDDDPAGLLIHPIYGQMQVVCKGFDRSVIDLPTLTDTVTLELAFVEDQVDLGIVEEQGAGAKAAAVTEAASELQDQTAPYTADDTKAAVQSTIVSALLYAQVALAAAYSNIADPSLALQLDQVGASLPILEAAILADPFALGTMQTYDALAAAEVLYAACLDLADQVALQTTGATTYIVTGATSIAVLAGALYGPNAISVIDQILRLNADRILDPTNIPTGTELVLPQRPTLAA